MDKYSAIWISHSSISNFKNCPRAYFLNNIYRDQRTGHKITIASPSMSLGSAVHEVLESLSVLKTTERFSIPLLERFESAWGKVSGLRGGFEDDEVESKYKKKGEEMLRRVSEHPGPINELAVKINMDLPYFWLSEEDNLILCGKIDWLEYYKETDSVGILDFKTGVNEESVDSLQLPIYYLLAHNCQTRKVVKASYWYIARSNTPEEKPLPDMELARDLLLKIGKEIKLARALERFKCKSGDGCKYCTPYERILRGEAEFVGTDNYNQDVYIFSSSKTNNDLPQSTIL